MRGRVTELLSSSAERSETGIIVTARDRDAAAYLVLHRTGPRRAALRAVCAVLDSLEGDWRVLTISSPESVYRDLQGTRARPDADITPYPEPHALGVIGRHDLLDPSLLARNADSRRDYERAGRSPPA